ncbi:MAG: hypothetical protein PF541_04465 [Prolixibacteraceae bacterium]|nr:hypothetical protein [Prolixibacteraceae bacterium]
MKNLLYMISLLVMIASYGCDEKEIIDTNNLFQLEGTWINHTYLDSTFTLKNSSKFIEDEYGITLNSDQTCIERKNSGWCGTPPVMYANFDGIWELNDSIISISVAYWGGMADYEWKIISHTDSKVEFYSINEEYNMEE